jgi:DNA mismatch repair protein MutS2
VIAGDPEVGDPVRIGSLGQVGELLALPDSRGEAEVQVGSLKLRVAARDLERLSRRKARDERTVIAMPSLATREIPDSELDLRGQRAEAVIEAVEQYLNDAYLGGLPRVRLVHGKGTGALRQVVRELLTRHPLVKSFGTPPQNQGGDGVTEVVLNQ